MGENLLQSLLLSHILLTGKAQPNPRRYSDILRPSKPQNPSFLPPTLPAAPQGQACSTEAKDQLRKPRQHCGNSGCPSPDQTFLHISLSNLPSCPCCTHTLGIRTPHRVYVGCLIAREAFPIWPTFKTYASSTSSGKSSLRPLVCHNQLSFPGCSSTRFTN